MTLNERIPVLFHGEEPFTEDGLEQQSRRIVSFVEGIPEDKLDDEYPEPGLIIAKAPAAVRHLRTLLAMRRAS